ncbi:hypothetical protein [Pseudomonas sp. 31 E 6]|uniref:hypothetical protein n=1 Tax=unclassified Pseudomonas TaxID=196821 RepID=UPI00081225E6|nr:MULTISPECIES: hypothetical protein [unclassified Pseudomonas]CRM01825.1 hypothetical protein [Pseudomonas sp. 31 E 6]CRM51559.1 hypothetical protein [Pseudomonas sp. 31 E 5]
MARYKPWLRLCAGVAAGLFTLISQAGTLQLTLYLDTDARKFLNANNQSIVIAVPNPASEANNTVIAITLPPPIGDSMNLVIEQDANLYIANGTVASVEVINMGMTSPVAYGNSYVFNGVQINGNGKGKDGSIGIYYDAPPDSQALITGLALYIYDSASGKPDTPSALNLFTLNRFQTRYISQPTAVVWALVGSDISSGSVLPTSVFTPLFAYSSYSYASVGVSSTFQLSRYLQVPFDAQNQAGIHFDTSINAFSPGPYPK